MIRRLSLKAFVAMGFAVAILLVLFVAPHASTKPDGLEKVAAEKLLDAAVGSHTMGSGPLAGYGVRGVGRSWLGAGLAGVVGIAVVFIIGMALFKAAKMAGRRRSQPAHEAAAPTIT